MKKSIFLSVFILFLVPQVSFALPITEFPDSPWTKKSTYCEKTMGKLGFGILNLFGGWTALASEYHEQPEDNFVVAFHRSIIRTVTNTVGGALHVITFPAPFDIRLPGGGASFE